MSFQFERLDSQFWIPILWKLTWTFGGSGPKRAYLVGMSIIIIANIASGFCRSRIPFDICRALAGIGSALSGTYCFARSNPIDIR